VKDRLTYDLLRQVYAAGAKVIPSANGKLRLAGHALPAGLEAELIANKPSVASVIAAHHIGEPSSVPEVEATRTYVTPCTNCVCPVLGPCNWYLASGKCPVIEHVTEEAA
jgi:hypothetical protein